MYLNELVVGQLFYVDSYTDMDQSIWVAGCDPFITKGLNGGDYWCVNAINMQTGVMLPFTVHKDYPHYMKLKSVSDVRFPMIEFEWTSNGLDKRHSTPSV